MKQGPDKRRASTSWDKVRLAGAGGDPLPRIGRVWVRLGGVVAEGVWSWLADPQMGRSMRYEMAWEGQVTWFQMVGEWGDGYSWILRTTPVSVFDGQLRG